MLKDLETRYKSIVRKVKNARLIDNKVIVEQFLQIDSLLDVSYRKFIEHKEEIIPGYSSAPKKFIWSEEDYYRHSEKYFIQKYGQSIIDTNSPLLEAVQAKLDEIKGQRGEIVSAQRKTWQKEENGYKELIRLGKSIKRQNVISGVQSVNPGHAKNISSNILKSYKDNKGILHTDIAQYAIDFYKKVAMSKAIIDFYPTDDNTIDEMLDIADIHNGMDILEPSAGYGNIADRIRAQYSNVNIDCVELETINREILRLKGYSIVGTDFLKYQENTLNGNYPLDDKYIEEFEEMNKRPMKLYDRIIMNPPFTHDAAMYHFIHAMSMLKPEGKIVCIMPKGTVSKNDEANIEFAEFVFESGNISNPTNKDVYKTNQVERQANVDIVIAYLDNYRWRQNRPSPKIKTPIERISKGDLFRDLYYTDSTWEVISTNPLILQDILLEARPKYVEKHSVFIDDRFQPLTKEEYDVIKIRQHRCGVETSRCGSGESSEFSHVNSSGKSKQSDGRCCIRYNRKPVESEQISDKDFRIVTAREELTPKAKSDEISKSVGKYLKNHQKENVNLALESLLQYGSFYDACGTGVGKTFQILATVHHACLYSSKDMGVIITYNADVAKGFFEAAEIMGISDRLEYLPKLSKTNVSSYDNKENSGSPYDVAKKMEKGKIYITWYSQLSQWGDNSHPLRLELMKLRKQKKDLEVELREEKANIRKKYSGAANSEMKNMMLEKAHKDYENNPILSKIIKVENKWVKEQSIQFQALTKHCNCMACDEAHRMKNYQEFDSTENTTALRCVEMIKAANCCYFASATPADRVDAMTYMKYAGLYQNEELWGQILLKMGFVYSHPKYNDDGELIIRGGWKLPNNYDKMIAIAELNNLFEDMTEDGLMIKKEISMNNLTLNMKMINIPAEAKSEGMILRKAMADDAEKKGKKLNMANYKNELNRVIEPYKISAVVRDVEEELAAGRSSIIFANLKEHGTEEKATGKYKFGTIRELHNILSAKYGSDKIGLIIGGKKASEESNKEVMRKFNAGIYRIVIANAQAGGTGVSLHDTIGLYPRTMHILSAPFNAESNVQMLGRITRVGQRSLSRASYYFAKGIPIEIWVKNIVKYKMSVLNAVVAGETENYDPSKADIAVEGEEDQASAYIELQERREANADEEPTTNKRKSNHELFNLTELDYRKFSNSQYNIICSWQNIWNYNKTRREGLNVKIRSDKKEFLLAFADKNRSLIEKYYFVKKSSKYEGTYFEAELSQPYDPKKNDVFNELWNTLCNIYLQQDISKTVSQEQLFELNDKVVAAEDIFVGDIKAGTPGIITKVRKRQAGKDQKFVDGKIEYDMKYRYEYSVLFEGKDYNIPRVKQNALISVDSKYIGLSSSIFDAISVVASSHRSVDPSFDYSVEFQPSEGLPKEYDDVRYALISLKLLGDSYPSILKYDVVKMKWLDQSRYNFKEVKEVLKRNIDNIINEHIGIDNAKILRLNLNLRDLVTDLEYIPKSQKEDLFNHPLEHAISIINTAAIQKNMGYNSYDSAKSSLGNERYTWAKLSSFTTGTDFYLFGIHPYGHIMKVDSNNTVSIDYSSLDTILKEYPDAKYQINFIPGSVSQYVNITNSNDDNIDKDSWWYRQAKQDISDKLKAIESSKKDIYAELGVSIDDLRSLLSESSEEDQDKFLANPDVKLALSIIPSSQKEVMLEAFEAHRQSIQDLANILKYMPRLYKQDGLGGKAYAFLHYFMGGSDWYISEIEVENNKVVQAYGFTLLNGDAGGAEYGYIPIGSKQHFLDIDPMLNLDLWFEPTQFIHIRSIKDLDQIASDKDKIFSDSVENKFLQIKKIIDKLTTMDNESLDTLSGINSQIYFYNTIGSSLLSLDAFSPKYILQNSNKKKLFTDLLRILIQLYEIEQLLYITKDSRYSRKYFRAMWSSISNLLQKDNKQDIIKNRTKYINIVSSIAEVIHLGGSTIAHYISILNSTTSKVKFNTRKISTSKKGMKIVPGLNYYIRAKGEKMDCKYALVELTDIIPSNDPHTFAKNPNYPETCQTRNYMGKAEQLKVENNYKDFDAFYLIEKNPKSNSGTPIITNDGIALAGNNRSMLLLRLHADGRFHTDYVDILKDEIERFKLTKEDLKKFTNPVLVRLVDVDYTKCSRYSNLFNDSDSGQMSLIDEGIALGKQLSDNHIFEIAEYIDAAEKDTFDQAIALSSVQNNIIGLLFKEGIINSNNQSVWINQSTKGFSDQGIQMLRGLLLGIVLPDSNLIDAAKNYTNKLIAVLPSLIRISTFPDKWNILPDFIDVIKREANRRTTNMSIREYLHQDQMFKDSKEIVPERIKYAWIALADTKLPIFRKFVQKYIKTASNEIYGGNSMFSHQKAEPIEVLKMFTSEDGLKGLDEDIILNIKDKSGDTIQKVVLPDDTKKVPDTVLNVYEGINDTVPDRYYASGSKFYNLQDIHKMKFIDKPLVLKKMKPFFGNLLDNANIMIWGDQGQGKSSFTLQLLEEIANNGFKILLVLSEEPVSQRLKNRLKNLNINNSNIDILISPTMDEILHYLNKGNYKYLVFDSKDGLIENGISENQLIDFFHKYKDELNYIIVSRADKTGKVYTGKSSLVYLVDTEIFVDNQTAYFKKHRDATGDTSNLKFDVFGSQNKLKFQL